MKLSIGHRLFASVLLAILAVAAGAVFLLRQNVLAGFGDYAVGIELDRLEELSGSLARQYRSQGGWTFLPPGDERRGWIAAEMTRLQRERASEAGHPPHPAAAVAVPQAPSAPVVPSVPAAVSVPEGTIPAPPAPVAPQAPPAPPEPPPPPPLPAEPSPRPVPEGVSVADSDGVDASLPQRVTLLDANGAWLAGRDPGASLPALARRPIEVDGRTVAYLGVARGARPSDAMSSAFLAQLRSSLWLIVAGAVALSALAAVLLARHFRKPIGDLAEGARRLAEGRFDTRLATKRSDELGELARHFNSLAEQLDAAEQARRRWVADTSHELRTPLAVLRAQLEAIQDGVRAATPDTVEAMLRQVLALNKLIDELYALARADVGALDCTLVPLDLWQLASSQADAFGERLRAAGLALDVGTAPDDATVLADPDRMRQVLDNLFENSLRYTAGGGRVALSAVLENGLLRLRLDDSAPGVPDEALGRLAQRFYRVDASRSRAHGGAGLGLALCARLLEAQGGALAFAHSPLGGLRATITLPIVKEAA